MLACCGLHSSPGSRYEAIDPCGDYEARGLACPKFIGINKPKYGDIVPLVSLLRAADPTFRLDIMTETYERVPEHMRVHAHFSGPRDSPRQRTHASTHAPDRPCADGPLC